MCVPKTTQGVAANILQPPRAARRARTFGEVFGPALWKTHRSIYDHRNGGVRRLSRQGIACASWANKTERTNVRRRGILVRIFHVRYALALEYRHARERISFGGSYPRRESR